MWKSQFLCHIEARGETYSSSISSVIFLALFIAFSCNSFLCKFIGPRVGFLEANAEQIKYMVTSRDQSAVRNSSINIGNKSDERVDKFKCLGTTLTNQNSILEEIKSRLKSENACCHSVQNVLSSNVWSKNVKMKIYRTVILPVILLLVKLVPYIEGGM